MQAQQAPTPPPALPAGAGLPLLEAADLQDHLLSASNDMDRLQRLLADACESLMVHFHGAADQLRDMHSLASGLPGVDAGALRAAMDHVAGAITAMQFQDMASQLVTHTTQRLRSCADRLARDAMGDDEDGFALVEPPPMRPNPVTQDEMDAGSVELF